MGLVLKQVRACAMYRTGDSVWDQAIASIYWCKHAYL